MSTPAPSDPVDALRQYDACTLANAIETFQLRLRNEGFTRGATRCVVPGLRPMVGYAATLKIRSASPPTGTRTYLDRTDWWDYILSVPGPRLIVAQDIGPSPGLGALFGEVHANIFRALGAVGALTNGAARDLPALAALHFPVHAGNLTVSHSYVHIVEFGTPVEVDGLAIKSGDLLHGDQHGVQSIPSEIAPRLPAVADDLTAHEQAIVALCRSPGFTLEKLRAAVSGASD
jgi:regulator of RNase E activity RraA